MADGSAHTKSEDVSSTSRDSNSQTHSTDKNDIEKPKIKYEWYQSDSHITVALLVKNVKSSSAKIEFFQQSFTASIETDQKSYQKLEVQLSHKIFPEQCTFHILTSKVEIKLSKCNAEKWLSLEEEVKFPKPISGSSIRNWDQVVETELKDDKVESDAALNELFQQIYSQGSDDVKKAMNKSFLESGGTVLSTNWKEVKRDTVEIKPPDGVEWKNWST